MKIPGILGGLGPETTAKIYLAVALQESQEYPGILISNVSFPKYLENEIIQKSKDCSLILPHLCNSIKQLEKAKVDFIVIPCNTLHSLLPLLREKFKTKFIDLTEEVGEKIREEGYRKVGILSTTKTKESKIYDNYLKNVEVIYPDDSEQYKVSKIIIRIIRKKANKQDRKYLENLIIKLKKRGAEKIILACTDLINLLKENKLILDTQEILIKSIITEMRKS